MWRRRDGDGEDNAPAKYKRSVIRRAIRHLRRQRACVVLAVAAVSLIGLCYVAFSPSTKASDLRAKLQLPRNAAGRGSEAVGLAAASVSLLQAPRGTSPDYCTQFPIYIDIGRPPSCTRPTVSIVFTTKRPGGIDILFRSLANQTSKDYELICVDELAQYRSTKMYAYARQLGVNLAAVVPSKPKMDRDMDKKFGIYKALNTGLLLASGDVIASVMDYAWLPDVFVERTAEFFRRQPKSFLAYPMKFIGLPDIRGKFLDLAQLENPLALSVWKEEMTVPLSQVPGAGAAYYWRPNKEWQDVTHDFQKQTDGDRYWELAHASAPWSAFEELNGYDEYLDSGDDCHEVNLRERSELIGYDLWIDGGSVVENVEHRSFASKEKDPQWQRFAEDTNINKHWERMGNIRNKKEDIRSDNGWDLKTWRQHDCAKAIYGLQCPRDKAAAATATGRAPAALPDTADAASQVILAGSAIA